LRVRGREEARDDEEQTAHVGVERVKYRTSSVGAYNKRREKLRSEIRCGDAKLVVCVRHQCLDVSVGCFSVVALVRVVDDVYDGSLVEVVVGIHVRQVGKSPVCSVVLAKVERVHERHRGCWCGTCP